MLSMQVNTSVPPPYTGYLSTTVSAPAFPERLAALRKQHSLTQQTLAERIGVHVVQLRRYEAVASQPALDVIRKIAAALQVSTDLPLFGQDERGPDDGLRLQFEAISRFDEEEKRVIRSLLDGMILKPEARRWAGNGGGEWK